MSRKGKFRYPLAPVLSKRQWDLDALLLELAEVNCRLVTLGGELRAIEDEARKASEHWKRQASEGALDISRFCLATQHMHDLASRRAASENAMAEKERQQVALIERIATAKRATEAVAMHRDEMKAEFIKMRLRDDFRSADDHWSALQARRENHDSGT